MAQYLQEVKRNEETREAGRIIRKRRGGKAY